jgi:hypothetical protein
MLPQVRSQAGGQAQVDRVLDDSGGEQGIQHLNQGITTASKCGIDVVAKGAQALKGRCVHAVSMPKRAFLVYSLSPSPRCWLNDKLRGH